MTRAALCLLILTAPTIAQDVAGAVELRDKASAAWRDGDYANGVKALREAVALYVGVDPIPVKQWALTMRMLTWHQMKNGELEGARATFRALVETLAKQPRLSGVPQEAEIAWRALREAASAGNDYEAGIALHDEAVKAFEAGGSGRLAAQVRHEAGNFSGMHKRYKRANEYLAEAARQRARIEDHLGYAWSNNQLAYWRIQASQHDTAREPLRDAYRTMCQRRLVVPQAAIESNLRTLLTELEQRDDRDDRDDAAVREWLTELATETGTLPRVLPRTYLVRTLLAWSLAGEDPISSVRLVTKELGDLAPAERADVLLQCAEVALQLDDTEQAKRCVTATPEGEGGVWDHLNARALAVRALTAGNAEEFARCAHASLQLFERLGDAGGLRASAGRLKQRAPFELDGDLRTRIDAVLRAGGPGGAGGSASGGGIGDISKMDLHDPLFTIEVAEGQVVVKDLAGGRDRRTELSWRPRNVGFNGLGLTLFGRYVVVQSLDYGGAAVAGGAPGLMTMAELGPYRPLPDGYRLEILRNGAARYARIAADNKGR